MWVLSTRGVDNSALAIRYIHATLSDVARCSAHALKSPKAPIASKKKNRLAQGDNALAYVQLSINYKTFCSLTVASYAITEEQQAIHQTQDSENMVDHY